MDLRKNCWLTCRHNNVLCGTQLVCSYKIHLYCMMTAFTACTIGYRSKGVLLLPPSCIYTLFQPHPLNPAVSYAILGSNYAEMHAKERIRNAFYIYIYVDLWTTCRVCLMSTYISPDDIVHTYMLSGHACPRCSDDGTTQCNGLALVPLSS